MAEIRLTEDERETLREAHWPIDPPLRDSSNQQHARMEAAVEAILAARSTAIPTDDLDAGFAQSLIREFGLSLNEIVARLVAAREAETRAVVEDALGEVIEREFEAFRLHHAELGTADTPAGFAARFREWITPHLTPTSEEGQP